MCSTLEKDFKLLIRQKYIYLKSDMKKSLSVLLGEVDWNFADALESDNLQL